MGKKKAAWTPELDAKLGTIPDIKIAAELGVSESIVCARRKFLNISAYTKQRWTPDREALLGKTPDAEIARVIGVTPAAVSKRRNKLGIEAYKEHLGTPKEKAKITHEEYKQHRLKRIFEQDVVKKTIKRIVKESSGLNADDLEKVLEYIQFIKNRSPRPK